MHSRFADNRAATHRRRPVSCQPCPRELTTNPTAAATAATAAAVTEPPPGGSCRFVNWNQNWFWNQFWCWCGFSVTHKWLEECSLAAVDARTVGRRHTRMRFQKRRGNSMVNYSPHVFGGHGFEINSGYDSEYPCFMMSRFVCHTVPRMAVGQT